MALAGALALGGCSSGASAGSSGSASADEPELTVSGAFMPQPVGDMAGGFLTVTNKGGAADTLTSVTSPLSDDIGLHESKNQKMRQVASFGIPANGELKLERGGSHIMFMNIKRKPKQGDTVEIELHFRKSDPVKVRLPVEAATHNPATEDPATEDPAHH
ncbi:copper chaperone PCu(A)C [Streptomyces ficellus]|uniref:Copper chaperone PCu(A)C n=2 Tax=Streptomyces ficellus TaxID=1977088 RepID=A0ABT7ZBL3_9ACTN|nr:copper chaperone PCu(A)C [Streptomyces ficellus]MDN3296900.1 copper chaperone PCu(A)C [Streptomyces ficellus]